MLRDNPDSVLLFNKSSCHLVIDMELLDNIKQTATDQRQAPSIHTGLTPERAKSPFFQTTEEDWDKVDPTPDFLK